MHQQVIIAFYDLRGENRLGTGRKEENKTRSFFLTSYPDHFYIVFYIISQRVSKKCKIIKETKKKILVSCVRVIPSCLFELQQMTGVVETSFPNTRLAFFSLFSFFSYAYEQCSNAPSSSFLSSKCLYCVIFV